VIIYRHIALAAPADRQGLLAREALPDGGTISLEPYPPSTANTVELPLPARQIIRASMYAYGLPPGIRPHGLSLRGTLVPPRVMISFGMPDGRFSGHLPMLPPDGDEGPPPNGPRCCAVPET